MIKTQKSIIAKFCGNKVFVYVGKAVTFVRIYFSSIGQNLLHILILKICTNKVYNSFCADDMCYTRSMVLLQGP